MGLRGGGAGWYTDPIGRYPQRYWDGGTWTASVLDSQGQVAVDYLGTPVSAPPPVDAASLKARDNRPLWWGTAALGMAIVVLVAAVLLSERRAADHTDKVLASQASAASDQLSDAVGEVDDAVSDLGSQLSDVESQVSDFTDQFIFDFTDFSDVEPPFDACDLVTPADVETVLAAPVKVDRQLSYPPYYCAMTTPATPDGTAVFVVGDVLGGDDLEDAIETDAPGGVNALTPVEVGDKAFVGTSYGIGFGAAAKGDNFVEIQVQSGGGSPSVEQLTELLRIAISHM